MSRVIHYFPLERLDGRYTTHLDQSIMSHFSKNPGLKVDVYYPDMQDRETAPPPKGMFLNAGPSCEFKARQLSLLARNYSKGNVKTGDLLFFSDLWFPGIEMIRYLDHFYKTNVEIRGLLHAGSFTDTDEVRKLERWAHQFENVMFDISNRVFVGSEFMKQDVCSKRLLARSKVAVTPFPLDPALKRVRPQAKRDLVVFNGRNHPEKQPHLWNLLKFDDDMKGIEFCWTTEMDLPKAKYYEILAQAKVVISFALQENFGFGIREAVALGCVPVVPNRLVYPEIFGNEYCYDSYGECKEMIHDAIDGHLEVPVLKQNLPTSEWFAE